MRIDISPTGRRHLLRCYRDHEETVFHTDTLNLHDDRRRRSLIRCLVNDHDIDQSEVESAILQAMQQLVAAEATPQSADVPRPLPYTIHDGHICLNDGGTEKPIANFTASIVEELTCDDGAEQSRHFVIEGQLWDDRTLPRLRIPSTEFADMKWIAPGWGSAPIIAAGRGVHDQVRAAIQEFSGDVTQRVMYRHLGWRQVGGDYVYLHAGGAIGAAGQVPGVEVDLPPALERYRLSVPPGGVMLQTAVRASLGILELAPFEVTVPIFGAVYRAVLGDTDFTIHLAGRSGSFKTAVAALAQQHYGSEMGATQLPASWSSTGNSLEGLAFQAKDALLVVDDFCPTGSQNQVQTSHREADRFLRAQGNRSGRQRMRVDGTLRPSKPPRGLVLSTGEDVPRGQSLVARILVDEIAPGDVSVERLSAAQQDAEQGLFAASMAGFIQWLAPRYESIQERKPEMLRQIRAEMHAESVHARTPGILAELLIGIRYFLQFAIEVGVLSQVDASQLEGRCRSALRSCAERQRDSQRSADPAQQFIGIIRSLLQTHCAHLETLDRRAPVNPGHCGWHHPPATPYQLAPGGQMIGWIHGDDVYLDPTKSIAAAQRMARDIGESIPLTERTLTKRLQIAGMLVIEPSQEAILHRLPHPHRGTRALRLRPGVLWEPVEPCQDPSAPPNGFTPHLCPGSSPARPTIGGYGRVTTRP